MFFRFLLTIWVASAVTWLQSPAPQASETSHHVYFTAVDRNGEPVTDLSASEISVREDGSDRTLVGVERATAPLHVALLVDDSGPGLRFIREATGRFIQRLAGLGQISLTSIGAKNTLLVDFTAQTQDLYNGVRQLTTRNSANAVDGAYLLDAVHDAVDALNTHATERPVIVVMSLENAEFSNRPAVRLLDELQNSRAVLYVVSLGKPTLKTMSPWNEGPMASIKDNLDENINRKKFLEDGARRSGGTFQQVLADSGVPTAMNGVAVELASQYVAVYRRAAGQESARKISVAVKRSGVKVRSRTELARGK